MGDWGQAGQGAAGGAATGAAIGSIVPGWGTAIGAGVGGLVGGLAGYFGGSDPREQYAAQLKQLAAGYAGRQAPQAGPANLAGQSQLVGNRGALIAQLEAMARGEGPSAARLQMQEGMDRAVAAQSSAAAGAGGRGVNAGAALRNASNQSNIAMTQGNRDMGVIRAQEQANAVGQLGQNINSGINSDNQMSQWNAGAQNSNQEFNAQMAMQMLGLNDNSQLNALRMAMGQSPVPMGTSIMAGGAQLTPALLQQLRANQQQQPQQQQYPSPGPVTDPGYGWGGNPDIPYRPQTP